MEKLDPRRILRGYNGRLFHDGKFLAQVNEWNGQLNVTNADHQPAGSKLIMGLFTGASASLTFVETVVIDDLLVRLLDRVFGGSSESFEFLSRLEGIDSDQEFVFRACEPDGTIDLTGVSPGTLLSRNWAWRCNDVPDLQAALTA